MSLAALTQIRTVHHDDSRSVIQAEASGELVFAVVGHIGAGTSTVAKGLEDVLKGAGYKVTILKASQCIEEWARREGRDGPINSSKPKTSERLRAMQDLGDDLRREDEGAVAVRLVCAIRKARAENLGASLSDGPVLPDGGKCAYILDSLRHPAEVHLLRSVYGSAFALVGVVCGEPQRRNRISDKFEDVGADRVEPIMEYDARAGEKYGQRVRDTFFLADVFLDNTVSDKRYDDVLRRKVTNEEWDVPDQLKRVVNIVSRSEIVRPTIEEHAMFLAYGAQHRSACLSRQVGAAVVDRDGNVIATGTNEAPRPGGGVYGQVALNSAGEDHRCANRPGDWRGCWNTRTQVEIVDELILHLPVEDKLDAEVVAEMRGLSEASKSALKLLFSEAREDLQKTIRGTRVGGLLEFSRAVHAEMDALLSAARQGVSTVATRVFVTTFPCHYCARHIVGAGVDEVQFIEPYPKSLATDLHSDAITTNREAWRRPSECLQVGEASERGSPRVLFRPFTGVAPRLYERAFLKKRPLKNDLTGELLVGTPDWGDRWDMLRKSYIDVETLLSEGINDDG